MRIFIRQQSICMIIKNCGLTNNNLDDSKVISKQYRMRIYWGKAKVLQDLFWWQNYQQKWLLYFLLNIFHRDQHISKRDMGVKSFVDKTIFKAIVNGSMQIHWQRCDSSLMQHLFKCDKKVWNIQKSGWSFSENCIRHYFHILKYVF